MIVLLGLIYSIYAVIVSMGQPTTNDNSDFVLRVSYGPTIQNSVADDSAMNSILIMSILLIVVVVVWMVSNMVINWIRLRNKHLVDLGTITAGDFSIMIENIPYKTTKQQLQESFDTYYQDLVDK